MSKTSPPGALLAPGGLEICPTCSRKPARVLVLRRGDPSAGPATRWATDTAALAEPVMAA
ncbi:hypothetical protein [Streptomyces sp. NPDC056468]|uniref:hypothetical protein n=1 Tax=Streptomyces sp. NPDC056468 TaxID=3345830 RepID=UPI0036AB3787